MMTDEQFARAVHGSGLVTREQLKDYAAQRIAGESLARTMLRLGALPPGEILRFDPHAFDNGAPNGGANAGVVPTNGGGASAGNFAFAGPNGNGQSGSHAARPPVAQPLRARAQNEAPTAIPANVPLEMPVEAAPLGESAEVGLGANNVAQIEGNFVVEGGDDNGDDPALAPVVRWANEMLKMAISMGASDVHLEPNPDGLLPRYRIDGALRSGNMLPIEISLPLISRLKVLANIDITEQRLPQDGRFRAHYGKRTFDFRVSTLPNLHGEKIVLRLLDHSSLVTDLSKLGFSKGDEKRFGQMLNRSHGMILVTGPTGSGKTTTLYAALAASRDETKNVITVEDPVEYELRGVTQTSVHSDIGLTFAAALRSILRQDPDTILVGEIRDQETADVAVRAALTGHLLLATLHTNSAVAAITRLQDMGIPAYLIASALEGVLAQRLARLSCRFCRQPVPADEPELEDWLHFFDIPPGTQLMRGVGCEHCGGTGTKGRVAIVEMLEIGPKLRRAIMAQKDTDELRRAAREEGFTSLRDDARTKLLAGYLSPTEAMKVLVGHED